ncbi:major facilitator superfamily domain-containing protein 1 [Frankliniella occidentalis]|uniref:Lysosomal dipeptide transporter MFSD1 n=1 Tax=Frankliniella occidentalis TaxID=133901 RepID=A0A6J1SSM4_FRAOC|nr:major facilitator superfamily domain-containing protein 1 [Frankliniella occidentalis]XP_026281507.1 major facilitator superfamily domain-containing protein 1 [Frankliniella occidentalis]XP_052124582.1 major facilitator superfamily domain-containing protein 1 [Frankliniella occidentalis]
MDDISRVESVNAPTSEDDSEQEQQGCGGSSCCNPKSCIYRFCGLVLMCLLGFGSYFCYDNPAALQDNFMQDLKINTSQFVYLYSWYSWPSVVLCVVGGFLMDRVFGIRLGTVIFALLVVIGVSIVALGAILNKFWLMVAGRFIFGIGGESLAVAQNTYAVLWFKGKELNMVFGLQMSFARVGSTVNFSVMEPIYRWVNTYYEGYTCTGVVLFFASITTVVSLLSTIILAWMDRRAERLLKRRDNQSGEVVRITDIKDFPLSFWMIALVCVAYYVAIFPFIALGKVFFIRKFNMTPDEANTVNSIVYTISAVSSPLFGIVVDKLGRNLICCFVSILVTIASHAILAFTFLNPFIGTSLMGLGYSMLASGLWPMVSMVIPEHQLGTAYGVMQSVQNLGLALITLVCGIIVDNGGYLMLEIFFLACLCVALVTTVVIYLYDSKHGGILNMSADDREVYEKNRISAEDLEREKLVAAGSMSDITPQDLLQPHSDFHIRNRYLSRIGANLPSHYNENQKGLAYRALR